jgi:hypothetical protein
MNAKHGLRLLISADHGLAIVYFLQTEVLPRLLEAGVEVKLLTEDSLVDRVRERFGRPGLSAEGLRLDRAQAYADTHRRELQWWLAFLRRVGGSRRINTRAMDSYIEQVAVEESNWRRAWLPLAWPATALLRRSAAARRALVAAQSRFTPRIYSDLLHSFRPDLVVASTAGWRLDRYLLREAHATGLRTAAVVVGWDNPSSYSIPGARVDDIVCWSAIQRAELEQGSDWPSERVRIGGIPIYDGYLQRRWQLARGEYFHRHGLDPNRKLLAYACSFVSFSPNIQNVEALARLVAQDQLGEPCQLLVRLHPNHFLDVPAFAEERQRIRQMARDLPNLRVVEPVALGEGLGHYSGEDMDEKSSMMAHADVFLTVYSTMVVEAALHDRPIVSACLDSLTGWDWPRKYTLPLSRIGDWPTHRRFREAGAGKVALDERQLREAILAGLQAPAAEAEARRSFVEREITYTDGSAGLRTAEHLLALLPEREAVR